MIILQIQSPHYNLSKRFCYTKWEQEHWVDAEGMFSWDGMHDGMETNINSRQTPQWFEGAPGYRQTLNDYLWSGANAISNIASLTGDAVTASIFDNKAAVIKSKLSTKMLGGIKRFFLPSFCKG